MRTAKYSRRTDILSLCAVASITVLGMAPALAAPLPTLVSATNPSFHGDRVYFVATFEAGIVPGTVRFDENGITIPGCEAVWLQGNGRSQMAQCPATALSAGKRVITATYVRAENGGSASASLTQIVAPVHAGTATVVANPYGALSVKGATLSGNTISNIGDRVEIRLGPLAGVPGMPLVIDFDGLNIGPGIEIIVNPGGPGQEVVVSDGSGNPSVIGGVLAAPFTNFAPGNLYVKNPSGLFTVAGGAILGGTGITVDTLGDTWDVGQPLVNDGVINAGPRLELLASQIHGRGEFRGNTIALHTFGNANNPGFGPYFLHNGLFLRGSADNPTSTVDFTLNAYGSTPQAINIIFMANAAVSMPSDWPAGVALPINNAVVPLPNGVRRAGVPDPGYGGGSMILQAYGKIALVDGPTHDFVFPGTIVLKADVELDFNGVAVNQGWTTSGQVFQGVFFESPSILSSKGDIEVYGNDRNWINFSTLPKTPAHTFALVRNGDGSASFAPSDAWAPHLNTASTMINTAANSGCWTCLINPQPVNVSGQ